MVRGSQWGWAGWGWGAGSPLSWPPCITRWGGRSPGQLLEGWIRANSTRSLLSLLGSRESAWAHAPLPLPTPTSQQTVNLQGATEVAGS